MQLSTNNDQKKKKNTQNYIVSFEHLHQTMQNKKKKKVSLLHIQLPKSSILVKLKICYLQSSYGNCVNLH